jgi:hypothetical protein
VKWLLGLLPSPRTLLLLGGVLVAVIVLASTAHDRGRQVRAAPTVPAGQVDFTGTGDIHFGATAGEVSRDHGLIQRPGDCGRTITDMPQVSPVFVDDKLALLWVNAPLHTPEGITVGSPVSQVRAAYPQASAVPAPDAGRYPAIMVTRDDRAYAFLYSGDRVEKVIVGLRQYVEQLYQAGGDAC